MTQRKRIGKRQGKQVQQGSREQEAVQQRAVTGVGECPRRVKSWVECSPAELRVEVEFAVACLPVGVPVVVPAFLANDAQALCHFVGHDAYGCAVVQVERSLCAFWFARKGWWWVIRYGE